MLKRVIVLLSLMVLPVASCLCGVNPARIDIRGVLFKFNKQPDVKIAYGHWQKPDMVKKYLTINFPAAEDWQTGKVTFTPQSDGTVRMSLLGPFIKGGSRTKLQPAGVYYDNFKINGKLIVNGDFSEGLRGWKSVPRTKNYPGRLVNNPLIAKIGGNCALAWHNGALVTKLKVKKNQPVTLTFDYKSAGDIPEKNSLNQYYPLPLNKVANMGLRDGVAGDGKGGWSDQGPANDLGKFPVGLQGFKNWPFRVVNPKDNNGKAMVVFKSDHSPFGIPSITVPVDKKNCNAVALLNTCAWGSSGETAAIVIIRFANGKIRSFPIRVGKETSDWWNPKALPNATTAWVSGRLEGEIGTFLTVLKFNPGKVESVKIAPGSKQVVFGLLGLTAGNIQESEDAVESIKYHVKLEVKTEFTALPIAKLKLDMAEVGIDGERFFDETKYLNRLEVVASDGEPLEYKIAKFNRNMPPLILVKTKQSTHTLTLKIGSRNHENILSPRSAFKAITGTPGSKYENDGWAEGIMLRPNDVKLIDTKMVPDTDSFYINATAMNAEKPEWIYSFELKKTTTFGLFIFSRSPRDFSNQVYVSFDRDNMDFSNVDGSIIKVGGNCRMPSSYYWNGGPRITLKPGRHMLKLIARGSRRQDFALSRFYMAKDNLSPMQPGMDDELRALRFSGFYVYGVKPVKLSKSKPLNKYSRTITPQKSFPDLSSLVDNNIDSNGVLKVDGNNFVFASGKPMPYLWGCNFGATHMVDSLRIDGLDQCLQRLKSMGYSSIRYMICPLHRSWSHNQNNRWGPLLSTNPLKFSDDFLPRLQKLVAACYRNNMYLNITLIGSRGNLIMTDLGLTGHNHSYIAFFLPEAIKRQKQFAKLFLDTPNPYRGNIRPADDPTIAIFEIENEKTFVATFQMKNPSDWRKLPSKPRNALYKLWTGFLEKKYGSIAKLKKTWGIISLKQQLKPGTRDEIFDNIEFPSTWKIDGWGKDNSDFKVKLDDLRVTSASYGKLKSSNPHVSDGLEFMYVIYRDYLKNMSEYVRSLGYKGIITSNGPDCELFYSQRTAANEVLDAVSGGTGYWNRRGYGFLRSIGWLSALVYFAAADKPIIAREYGANLAYENCWWGNLIAACVHKAMNKAYLFNFCIGIPRVTTPDWLYPDDSFEKHKGINLNQEAHLYSHFANLAAAIAVRSNDLKKPEFKLDIGFPLDNVAYAAPFRGYNKMTLSNFSPFLYTDSAVKTFHGKYDGNADLVINEPSIPSGDYSSAKNTFMIQPHSSRNRYGIPEKNWLKGKDFKAEGFMRKTSERQALYKAIVAAGGKMPVTIEEYGKIWRDSNRKLEIDTVKTFFKGNTSTFGTYIGSLGNVSGNTNSYYDVKKGDGSVWSFYGKLPDRSDLFFAVMNGSINLKEYENLQYVFVGTKKIVIDTNGKPFIKLLAGDLVNVAFKSDTPMISAQTVFVTFMRNRSTCIPAKITFSRKIKALYACDAEGNKLGTVKHHDNSFENLWGEGGNISFYKVEFNSKNP